jgi:phosphinothricin acetyltransferase
VRVEIRPAKPDDLAAVHAIYSHHVLKGLASFEEVPPAREEIARRYQDVTSSGLPWIVAQYGDRIAGYGYCALYRTRSAYRYSLEDSIYVHHEMHGRGIGSALLAELIRLCEAAGYRQLIAVIGDSAHAASINLHAAAGFVRVGTLRSVGFKFGRWVDSVIMQRPLGSGDAKTP